MYMKDIELAKLIAKDIDEIGGKTYFVGGYVRDLIRGIESNDIDIEVFGVPCDKLENILNKYGTIRETGKSFGIYGINGYDLDIALPRKEECIGNRHQDFKIDVDPNLSITSAARRRDFTINAIMKDVITEEILDPYDGLKDLVNKKIKHIDDVTFVEDALRVFRAAQFAARFNFEIDEKTIELCKTIDTSNLSKERVYGELIKALMLSDKPSIFVESLRKMNQLIPWFEEIHNLIGIEQSAKHHAEGDAYVHTLMVLDAARFYRDAANHPEWYMVCALCHDVGKAVTTKIIDGKIKSKQHDILGKALAYDFMYRITNNKDMIRYVVSLVGMHMSPLKILKNNLSIEESNVLFDKAPDANDLIYLSFADNDGKISEVDSKKLPVLKALVFERYEIYKDYMSRDYVKGEDLINLGYKPGDDFKEILEYAHEYRLKGVSKNDVLNAIKLKFLNK